MTTCTYAIGLLSGSTSIKDITVNNFNGLVSFTRRPHKGCSKLEGNAQGPCASETLGTRRGS